MEQSEDTLAEKGPELPAESQEASVSNSERKVTDKDVTEILVWFLQAFLLDIIKVFSFLFYFIK